MKHLFIILLSIMSTGRLFAWNEVTDTLSIDAVFEACVTMQESIETNDFTALSRAAEIIKENNVSSFALLRCKDETIPSLKSHFVFNDLFVDSLLAGDDPYGKADIINSSSSHRGQTEDGSILTKTCFVKAGGSTTHSFPSRGIQELGIVTEPGGKIYVRIHVTNHYGLDEWHDDYKSAKDGTNRYKTVFRLPMDKRNTVEIEVVNKGDKDISFVVISN